MSSSIRDLNIKKNAVVRVMKDISFSDKEIERQKQRIQQYKDDETRDGYDVKKQEEVLDEYLSGRKDELQRLAKFREELELYIEECDADEALKATEEMTAAKKAVEDASQMT